MSPDHSSFIKAFYKTSDTPTAEDEYVEAFAPNATMVMGLKKVTGHERIRSIRRSMWTAVETRHHAVSKVYPATNNNEDELMLFGTVDYGLKNGRTVRNEWAGRMIFEGEKLAFYQVWLDASPLLVATGRKIEGDAEGNVLVV